MRSCIQSRISPFKSSTSFGLLIKVDKNIYLHVFCGVKLLASKLVLDKKMSPAFVARLVSTGISL